MKQRVACTAALAVAVGAAGHWGGDSCEGHCGNWADTCWCNDGCEAKRDCCADYQEQCAAPGGQLRQVSFDASKYPDAVCLDGSPGGYFVRQGRPDAFLMYFAGGGWCLDRSCTPTRKGTLKDCNYRAQFWKGSSKTWSLSAAQRQLTGMLSGSPVENPDFHNFTLVYLPCCDGASFTGNATATYRGSTLHFKGTAILNAIIADLKATTSIASAKRVVLSGESAGSTAVYYHADKIVEKLGIADGVGVAVPDTGFFLDLPDRTGVHCWPNQMRSTFEVANGYADLHAGCLARYPGDSSKCLFPEYYADLIATRWMIIMSLYDESELWSTLRLDCCPGSCGIPWYPKCGGAEMKLFEDLRLKHLEAWRPLAQKMGNGQWAPACIIHTMASRHWQDTAWEVPSASGNTMSAVVHRWLFGGDVYGQDFNYTDSVAWPGNEHCRGYDHENSFQATPPSGSH